LATPYDFDCNCDKDFFGRLSSMFLNRDLHNVYEAVKHLIDYPDKETATPVANHLSSLWFDRRTNQLYSWIGQGNQNDKARNGWLPVFQKKFQIFDTMTSEAPDANPIKGQLWIYNDVLLFFDGASWKPVRALEQSESQFNTAMFADFMIASPLNRMGSAVISDFELEAYLEFQRRYLENDLDIRNNADMSIGKRWDWGDIKKHEHISIGFDAKDIVYQYLVPNIKLDRIFVDDRLDTNYVTQNNCTIQYKRSFLLEEDPIYDDDTPVVAHVKVPSLVHVNPSKISGMTKRLIKVDRTNPKIYCSAHNTEFYGYYPGDIKGHFLRPCKPVEQNIQENQQIQDHMAKNNEILEQYAYGMADIIKNTLLKREGDYEISDNCIILSDKASQQYSYILAVTFSFSWINAKGNLKKCDSKTGSSSFYVPDRLGAVNIFINGFDYENSYYSFDSENKVVTVAEDISDKEKYDISVMSVFKHEYGFIREVNIATDNRTAYISTITTFKHPLVFVNGEALCRSQWSYYNKETLRDNEPSKLCFKIPGVKKDMCWTIIDMCNETPVYDENGILTDTVITDICIEDNGYIPLTQYAVDSFGNPAIRIPSNIKISYVTKNTLTVYREPKVILFVNGLMIKKEDVKYDFSLNVITCNGLKPGMHYVLLNDTDDSLYTEDMENGIMPALSLGKIDETLVYHNGFLLNEKGSYETNANREAAKTSAVHGEVREFTENNTWAIFDATDADPGSGIYGVWKELTDKDIADIKSFSNSYTNTRTAIALAKQISTRSDNQIVVFGYQLAGLIENPVTPVNYFLHLNDNGSIFLKEAGYSNDFLPIVQADKANAVYCNKLNPSDPTLISDYKENRYSYYYFLLQQFNRWKEQRSITGKISDAALVAQYLSDAQSKPITLSGYFYEEVYMRNDADKEQYLLLKDKGLGSLWVNKMFLGKDFDPNHDYVAVWINGIRQYPNIHYVIEPVYYEERGENIFKGYNLVFGYLQGNSVVKTVSVEGFVDTPVGEGHRLPERFREEPLTGLVSYVIYRADKGDGKVCRYTILDDKNMISGHQNVYTTRDVTNKNVDKYSFVRDTSQDFSLYPGTVTVYVDGIRLPKEAYTILDNYTFVIHDFVPWVGGNRYPNEKYLDHNETLQTFRHLQPERLLVEVRDDPKITERTVTVNNNFTGNLYIYDENVNLPYSILDTQDTIMIFVDGMFYGLSQNDGYVISKTSSTISLNDNSVISAIREDNLEQYSAIVDIRDIRKEELNAYKLRRSNKQHQITMEWR